MNKTIHDIHKELQNGLSVSDFVAPYSQAITEKNDDINAFIEVFDISEDIQRAQKMFDEGTATLMTGIPVAIKDNILILGKEATGGSDILKGHIAPYEHSIITRLRKDGAIFMGRTNMDEMAMGSSTETSAYGPTKNPLDISRVPGGSSGGSAAALAMGGAHVALGSDTGGSIRQPASFCGLVGLHSTYGTVSRSGLMALSSSLDQVGPFAHNTSDAKLLWEYCKSIDEKDATSVEYIAKETVTKKLAIPKNIFDTVKLPKDAQENFDTACDTLRGLGYEIDMIDVPSLLYALPAYYIIQPAEASSNLARYDGMRYGMRAKGDDLLSTYMNTRKEGFGEEVQRRILLGTYVLSHGYYDAYYNKAVAFRGTLRKELKEILSSYDAIITPTTPSVAFKIGEKTDDPVSMYFSDIFTVPANIAHLPAISVPSGVDEDGMPFGLHLLGDSFSEEILLEIGRTFEEKNNT
ncbi:MAG: aspartyl-tRNA(Asn)/glutamyl-tRNA(Gln) amidotransferase subunit A [Flavobacteriaceae bacterium]|jgi:aspartyl-tRNA(Asn)/glutamyl-tRNA(Gln) amidotransferase subunit A